MKKRHISLGLGLAGSLALLIGYQTSTPPLEVQQEVNSKKQYPIEKILLMSAGDYVRAQPEHEHFRFEGIYPTVFENQSFQTCAGKLADQANSYRTPPKVVLMAQSKKCAGVAVFH